jgi:polysaccharide export outer membrane protein
MMHTLLHLRTRWLAISCCLALAGCAPGMRWTDKPDNTTKDSYPSGQGALIPINAELLAQLQPRASLQIDAQQFDAVTAELLDWLQPQAAQGSSEKPGQAKSVVPDEKKPYVLGAGDVLGIQLPEYPELLNQPGGAAAASTGPSDGFSPPSGYLIDADGYLNFPYAGNVRLAGMTVNQAREYLTKAISRYLRNPQVVVRVNSYRSQRVYVDGEVRTPGVVTIADMPLTIPDALSRAGGPTAVGDISNLVLVRGGKSLHIDLPALTERGINPMDLVLHHRDLLRVGSREDRKVYVLGEVQRPMALPLRNGRLSLNDALGEAAGPNPNTSNARQIYVVRTASESAQPLVYHLNAQSPAALVLAEKFPLQAKDVVFVDPAPLATWNRVLSLILPSAAAISTTNTLSSGN